MAKREGLAGLDIFCSTSASLMNSRAGAYFDLARKRFHAISRAPATAIIRNFRIGSHLIRLEVSAGEMADAILPALSHLTIDAASEPSFTILAWDGDGTLDEVPHPTWKGDDYHATGYVKDFNDDRFHTAIQYLPTIFRMIDFEERYGLYWTRSGTDLPSWERAAPLRPLLHEWLWRVGLLPIHGGAVGFATGGVILAGAGGRGKSNVALACLASGLLYASDDFCCLSNQNGWIVHSLYCTGKLSVGDLARHPHLRGALRYPGRLDRHKAVFLFEKQFAQSLVREMPVRAILMPRVEGRGQTRILPASRAAAQRAIAISTMVLAHSPSAYTFSEVANLVRDIPCYDLSIGASIREVPTRIAELLNQLG